MRIIKFYEKYRKDATKEAFVDRKLISRWRKRLKDGGLSAFNSSFYPSTQAKTLKNT